MTRPVKNAVNSPHTEEWLKPIGKLAVNFGAIELMTYWWLGALSGGSDLPRQAIGWRFKKRVDHITALVRSSIHDANLCEEACAAWQEAVNIASFRNSILHSPIIFGWNVQPEIGPPDVIGLPDVAHLGTQPTISKPIGSLAEINKVVNREVVLAHNLYDLLTRLDETLASMSGSS